AAEGRAAGVLPSCVWLGELPPWQAARVRAGYGLPDGALHGADAAHPLALRMLSEIRAAQLPGSGSGGPDGSGGSGGRPARAEIFSAHLDLVCLRLAARLAAERQVPGGGEVRRLAARGAGRLHEAARRCLGPGQGGLDRTAFEEIFPWGGGWAPAVLAEGVLVPAGEGYRFGDEEFADWLQGRHLELDAALEALVHRRAEQPEAVPVPRHRIGPVVQSLLLCGRRDGAEALTRRLLPLVEALFPDPRRGAPDPPGGDGAEDAVWWAAHLLGETLLRVPDARPYGSVLRALAERVADGPGPAAGRPTDGFGPWFWRRLPLRVRDKAELLRLLLPADDPYGGRERYLDVLGELLAAEPRTVQPLLCEWFSDLRALPRRPDTADDSRLAALAPTVATAAQALLYAHRGHAVDHLTEALVAAAHPRADELLAELVHDEPPAMCRAIRRWAHDDRVERRAAAATHGLRAASRVRAGSDRAALRDAALALLHRPGEGALHGAALALLVRDPHSRSGHLDAALARFAETGEPELVGALAAALTTHPEPVLAVFHTLLTDPSSAAVGPVARTRVLRALAELRTPALARRAACLVRAYVESRPEEARTPVAGFVRRRLAHGPPARAVLRPLVAELLSGQRAPFRAGLARTLGAGEGPLRDELLELLLTGERDVLVLGAALAAVVRRGGETSAPPHPAADEAEEGELVRRIGLAMTRTPQGAASFDRSLVELAREVPGFAAAVRGWVARAPGEWAAVVGPSARRMCETLADRP
ncbi:serine protease, partial [Streptomyces sp. SB3404]|nr:serine protease [Streptomyces boncukensis]